MNMFAAVRMRGAHLDENEAVVNDANVIYVVVLTFGVLGNGLVFVTVASAPRMRTATNIFIANLALADCFVCAFDLPLNLHYQVAIITTLSRN